MANMEGSAITAEEIEQYRQLTNPKTGRKYTQNDIAEIAGVSRQRISQIKRQSGNFYRSPREIALENYPWQTGERFHEASPNRRLRDYAEYRATGGKGMETEKLRRLRWFLDRLWNENLVVEFNPNLPPEDGVSSVGGFAYRHRKGSDGKLIIRVNQYTNLTGEGERIWTFPKKWPEVH